jgi:hypothetical protein
MTYSRLREILQKAFGGKHRPHGPTFNIPELKVRSTTVPQLNRPGNRIVGRTITVDDLRETLREAEKLRGK